MYHDYHDYHDYSGRKRRREEEQASCRWFAGSIQRYVLGVYKYLVTIVHSTWYTQKVHVRKYLFS